MARKPVTDPTPHKTYTHSDARSYWTRLLEYLHPGIDSTNELIKALSDAESKQVINAESRIMLEGVLRMANLTAGDV
ncbi:MAG: magnesium transporter, partial [Pseudomonadota bacterium]